MKTKEELNALRNELETLNRKLAELNEEELGAVTGGLRDMPQKNDDEKYVLLKARPLDGNMLPDAEIIKGPTSSR